MSVVSYREEHNICYITLQRAEKRNAFNAEMIVELKDAFMRAGKSKSRLVVLSGEGPSFSAGADLSWMKSMVDYSLEENIVDSEKLFEMFESAKNCSLPMIAKVQGHAMGGALGLIAVCDIVVAEINTKFAFSEVKIGLAPAVISPFVLQKGRFNHLQEWMLTGRMFSAIEAKDGGLVNFIGESDEVDKYVIELERRFRSVAPEAVRETKRLIGLFAGGASWDQIKKETTEAIAKRRVSSEGQAGLKGFFDKKNPEWNLES